MCWMGGTYTTMAAKASSNAMPQSSSRFEKTPICLSEVVQRQTRDRRTDGEKGDAGADGDGRDQPCRTVDLQLQRADLRLDALREGGDTAQLRRHAGGE